MFDKTAFKAALLASLGPNVYICRMNNAPPRVALNPLAGLAQFTAPLFDFETAERCARFLSACGHNPTPLRNLGAAAADLGLASLHIKDEANVLSQKTFKARGVAWAVANICRQDLGLADLPQNLSVLRGTLTRGRQTLLFVSATDGNHGAALAAIAKSLNQEAVIFMPCGTSSARINTVSRTGAKCIVTDCNYDETVIRASDFAQKQGGILVQDTSWNGYEQIPLWIMEGYATMAHEIAAQMSGLPDHVFLQAGVGSFAGAMIQAFLNLAEKMRARPPQFFSLEPDQAACVYESIRRGDGTSQTVRGEMRTIMAGLACGTPGSLAWPLLRCHLSAAFSCPDWVAATGVRRLANPAGADPKIISGESGAPGMGLLEWLMHQDKICARLGLNRNSKVLLISTEGATDPASWTALTGARPE